MVCVDKMKCARADCHFVDLKAREADEEDKDEGEDMDHCASKMKHMASARKKRRTRMTETTVRPLKCKSLVSLLTDASYQRTY